MAPAPKQRTAKQAAARRRAIRERVSQNGRDDRQKQRQRVQPAHAERIARFHTLEKLKARARDDEQELRRLESEQEALGGLEGYQSSSLKGQNIGGQSSKWLVNALEDIRGRRATRLLDVGAIDGTAYRKYSSFQCDSIDLRPSHPSVVQADFLTMETPSNGNLYDVVCLSLVLNFVGSIQSRTEMLKRARSFVKDDGYLYVVLPLACVENSRYLDVPRLTGILKSLGWAVRAQHNASLLTYWLVQVSTPDDVKWPRVEVRKGIKRNNFVILVK